MEPILLDKKKIYEQHFLDLGKLALLHSKIDRRPVTKNNWLKACH